MIFRYAFTHSPSFNSDYFILWNGGPGDVASMWLTILIIEAIVFFALAWLCADAGGSARSARDLHCADRGHLRARDGRRRLGCARLGPGLDRLGLSALVVAPPLAAAVPFLSFSTAAVLVWAGAFLWGAVVGAHESTMRAAVADLVPAPRRDAGYLHRRLRTRLARRRHHHRRPLRPRDQRRDRLRRRPASRRARVVIRPLTLRWERPGIVSS
jgi:hypothetical protein